MINMFNHSFGPRAQRGDLEPIILCLLREKPMHGYEIIRTLEERSHGLWRPSPGSVYPILQFLEEQDLVANVEKNGKKVYTITEKGMKHVHSAEPQQPWQANEQIRNHFMEMRDIAREAIHIMRDIAVNGDDAQRARSTKALQEFIVSLRSIAQGTTSAQSTDSIKNKD
jgi:DNA-binding PadR family transcriptional regulator